MIDSQILLLVTVILLLLGTGVLIGLFISREIRKKNDTSISTLRRSNHTLRETEKSLKLLVSDLEDKIATLKKGLSFSKEEAKVAAVKHQSEKEELENSLQSVIRSETENQVIEGIALRASYATFNVSNNGLLETREDKKRKDSASVLKVIELKYDDILHTLFQLNTDNDIAMRRLIASQPPDLFAAFEIDDSEDRLSSEKRTEVKLINIKPGLLKKRRDQKFEIISQAKILVEL
ncbi:MAG: hypothetical protein AAGA64_06395 [Bacteroidota bacterium]